VVFSERLNFILKSRGITQADLADSCGIAAARISDWKREKTLPPTETAIKIAGRLDVSLDFLLTGENREGSGLVLSDEEETLLMNYLMLSPELRKAVIVAVTALAEMKNV
jgi:transcriptional regulator with XRE-family HTH domain